MLNTHALCPSVLKELYSEPTKEELKEPLRSLASGKALGQGGIPAEILKCRKGDAFTKFCGIFCLCWMEGEVPQDMRDVNIVIPFKSEGDRGECNDYRGISLLSITKKTLWSRRLEDFPSVCRAKFIQGHIFFRAKRSTIDMIFSIRWLQEKT